MILQNDAIKAFMKAYPKMRVASIAKKGDLWYIVSRNTLNGGENLDVIENGYFSVDQSGKVSHVSLFHMPTGLQFTKVNGGKEG